MTEDIPIEAPFGLVICLDDVCFIAFISVVQIESDEIAWQGKEHPDDDGLQNKHQGATNVIIEAPTGNWIVVLKRVKVF